MLNYLWAFMLLIGVIWGALHGNLSAVTDGALTSAKEAVMLCITMLGIMSFWTGLMEIGRKSGLIERLSAKMGPVLHFLFPKIPEKHPSLEYISTNIIANILGLGWAATPAGLKAMESLKDLEETRRKEYSQGKKIPKPVSDGTANNEMCTFMIINISSLQLIPVNMIAYRSQYGSLDPTAIVGPAIAATLFSTVIGVALCKLLDR
ncbi:spore maturation protein A [Lacrimispora xylanisolvens]|uniref:Spore maturation protein A n=1 Tax=Lacrimispora xylanisolvens TaxID=384636 RepID=A0A2S6HEG9_9FIRM|nr:nucleoside recognition domain-containing protein [Hungatella xylanolytica]MBE5989647.1 nucleoside recognition protein [Paenibacillaceae bacterium]MTK09728.1 nucleoside recognition protein [Hungatella sp.]PPK75868.1 spore maturation protein A [Hungatella xylanolytica]